MSLSDVTILITAGGRPGYLKSALRGINANLPECKVVVVNDSGELSYHFGVMWREMPPDTFLTRKRNAGVSLVDTKYTLLAADDFEFDIQSRATVINMVEVLDLLPEADLMAGTVNNRPYEGFLSIVKGEYIKETRLNIATNKRRTDLPAYGNRIWRVDLAANFFLARTRILREFRWDEAIGPIGGEHADWFLDLQAARRTVLWSPILNINEQEKDKTKEDPGYRERRARAQMGHELMLKKRGVKRYVSFDEEVK
jgi:hypothetical protein